METAVLLEHLRVDDDGSEHIKTIGIYRTLEAARGAVERLKDKPGFCDNPNIIAPDSDDEGSGFYISTYPLDKDYWVDGFGWEDDENVA